MQRTHKALVLVSTLLSACAGHPDKRTLAVLHRIEPDMKEVQVANGLDAAMRGYLRFLEGASKSVFTPEAMRRLADLKLEKAYGIFGGSVPATLRTPQGDEVTPPSGIPASGSGMTRPDFAESDRAFEQRAAARLQAAPSADTPLALPDGQVAEGAGPRQAIALYDEIVSDYPNYEHNDRVLYQKARAYDELGRPDEAIAVIEELIHTYPNSRHIDEVQFRRAEYFFTRRRYLDAEEAYGAIARRGPFSDFYELALYKLGWTLYKQELHEDAVHQYVALLDHMVSSGYDFEQSEDQDAGRRVADTFRVVSLSFSSIGGPKALTAYFNEHGVRPYEDRIYRHLGEFYFEKLRYQDAASAYEAFVARRPLHRFAPHFGMRVAEIYEAGGFPQLVLSAKKEFAARYEFSAEYWHHRPIEEAPEVVAYLKSNLRDLANHYHAAYQDPERAEASEASFGEAQHWYRAFLSSFTTDAEAPVIHHQLADLLLEHEDFGEAAREYEQTAYGYPPHDQAADAGYAAIFAHREQLKRVSVEEHEAVRRAAVLTTLRFVDTFPSHQHANVVLGAAVDDLYELAEYESAIASGRRLLEAYPDADASILRSALLAVAHSAFGVGDFPHAELAYARVLEMTAPGDESHQAVTDNLAASIYKQGELASQAEDHRAAADHFLRIAQLAPETAIRPLAEYDGAAALLRLEDWGGAVSVLNAFREAHPEHALYGEATRQLAQVYREQGDLERAAAEYERIAAETADDELRREALLTAGELFESVEVFDRAIAVYRRFVSLFPEPFEQALETRFKVATLYEADGDTEHQHEQLRRIVEADRTAAGRRTDRIRYLAARSSLVLTEVLYARFAEIDLVQPFERSLKKKQQRMDEALSAFSRLADYEVGEVTAAATFYIAEAYRDFSAALFNSERPENLSQGELLDYELALEEEAFPFEEKAIELHEKNLELMGARVFNRWIEKSLVQLAGLMPGRYAKFEESSGLIASVDRYAYSAPKVPPALPTHPAPETPADPPTAPDEPLNSVEQTTALDLELQPEPEFEGSIGANLAER